MLGGQKAKNTEPKKGGTEQILSVNELIWKCAICAVGQ